MVTKRNIVILGFMLFSLFFGAGNLIFPPFLGMESGQFFTPAIGGFILTAVFIPFLAILSVSLSKNGLLEIGQQVGSLFGLIFTIIIYLSIGALYGIPRASSVAYELGFVQVASFDNQTVLFLFTIIFFAMTYYLSIDPKKMIDRIGQILTPGLIIVLTILFIKAFTTLQYDGKQATEKFAKAPFLTGILEGYYTMDAIAALAFGIVIVNGLKELGVTNKGEIIRGTAYAGIIASIGLTIVYISLSWIGRVMPYDESIENGADILVLTSQTLFHKGGSILFGLIVLLACLTTCVGLTNACAQFFNDIYDKISYRKYVLIFVIIGLLITNLGLNTILAIATPILVFIYPLAIVLIVLSLIQTIIGESKKMYVFSIIVTFVFALLGVLDFFEINMKQVDVIFSFLPLYGNGLGWVLPAFIASLCGYLIDYKKENINKGKSSP